MCEQQQRVRRSRSVAHDCCRRKMCVPGVRLFCKRLSCWRWVSHGVREAWLLKTAIGGEISSMPYAPGGVKSISNAGVRLQDVLCLIKCLLSQITQLKSYKFLSQPRDMTDYTLLPNQSSFVVHGVHDVTRKEALATDYYYYWQGIMRGKQKIKHASLSVVKSWGVLDAASVVVHYGTLGEMKQ